MKVLITRVCAGLLIAATASTAGWYAGAQDGAKDKQEPVRTLKVNEVARVGQRVITAEEYIQRIVERERLYPSQPELTTAAWALDSLIMDEMLHLEASRLGVIVKRRELNAETDEMLAEFDLELKVVNQQITEDQRNRGHEENPYTKDEYLKAKFGLTFEQYKKKLEERARRNLTLRMVVNYWKVSTRSADIEGVFCRSRDKATKARERLLKGEDIGIVARQESEDVHSRQGGGYLGTAYPNDGTLKPEVEAALWEIEKGKISHVIEVDNGFWVIRKKHEQLPNEAPFYDQREVCLNEMSQPNNDLLLKWRYSVASSGLYTYERRLPGVDVRAGEE